MLLDNFDGTDNFPDAMGTMLSRNKRLKESYVEYYYTKLGLIIRVRLTGRDAVQCLFDGVEDHAIRMMNGRQEFDITKDVYRYFRGICERGRCLNICDQ